MAIEDDRWALLHLKDVDERGQSFGVGTFRMRDEDGLVHRIVWGRDHGRWVRLCDRSSVKAKMSIDQHKQPDPGAITCFMCLGKGA